MKTHTLEAGQFIEFINPQFTSFHSVFHSFHGLMNSINWPASSVWVFIAQLGEHCSANAEATGSNPVEAPKIFFSGYFRNCLNCDSLRWPHTHLNPPLKDNVMLSNNSPPPHLTSFWLGRRRDPLNKLTIAHHLKLSNLRLRPETNFPDDCLQR